jgi:hypothetical protein
VATRPLISSSAPNADRLEIFVTFVQAANLITVIALISDPHPRAEVPNGGKLLDREWTSAAVATE